MMLYGECGPKGVADTTWVVGLDCASDAKNVGVAFGYVSRYESVVCGVMPCRTRADLRRGIVSWASDKP